MRSSQREFPSARALMPDLAREFFENPQGLLGTVYCRRLARRAATCCC